MASTVTAEASAAVNFCVSDVRSAPSYSWRRSASRLAQMVVVSMTKPVILAGRPSGPGTTRPRASIVRTEPSRPITR